MHMCAPGPETADGRRRLDGMTALTLNATNCHGQSQLRWLSKDILRHVTAPIANPLHPLVHEQEHMSVGGVGACVGVCTAYPTPAL